MTSANTETYAVTIDNQPFGRMIAAGAYDHVNNQITEANFPVKRGGPDARDMILVHMGGFASTDAVLHALDDIGVRPGRIEELLAFGAAYPQRLFPIVALAAIEASSRRRAFLWGSCRARHLDLRFDEKAWRGNIRFLNVRR